ncbi:hypothetical protein ACFXKG_30525 [Streptomyces sp. NPDC059255]|uniref:hypothetical protein n=1 Tax=Streptomyces sp. NPDC059255 TaxID=3346793 RepID=UPI0036ABA964
MHDHPDTPQPEPGNFGPDASEPATHGRLRPEERRQGAAHDVALQRVMVVMGWYRHAITQERYTGTDAARLRELMDGLLECVADQQALEEADPDEADRIARLYQDRYAALTSEE